MFFPCLSGFPHGVLVFSHFQKNMLVHVVVTLNCHLPVVNGCGCAFVCLGVCGCLCMLPCNRLESHPKCVPASYLVLPLQMLILNIAKIMMCCFMCAFVFC